jgi:hypothetical protein
MAYDAAGVEAVRSKLAAAGIEGFILSPDA